MDQIDHKNMTIGFVGEPVAKCPLKVIAVSHLSHVGIFRRSIESVQHSDKGQRDTPGPLPNRWRRPHGPLHNRLPLIGTAHNEYIAQSKYV